MNSFPNPRPHKICGTDFAPFSPTRSPVDFCAAKSGYSNSSIPPSFGAGLNVRPKHVRVYGDGDFT